MTAREFIAEKLRELHAKFPQIQIRYEYRMNTKGHMIEIMPLHFIENDEAYGDEEEKMFASISTRFPEAHIIYIPSSEDFLSEIKKPDLELG